MMTNYEILEKSISKLRKKYSKFIRVKKLEDNKKLFLVDNDYPGLPSQIISHQKIRLPDEIDSDIVKEMESNKELRGFLCVDFQNFINLLENKSSFKKFFSMENLTDGQIDEMRNIILDEYYDPIFSKSSLKILKLFGFIRKKEHFSESDIEEPKVLVYNLLENYYFRMLKFYFEKEYRVNFKKNILEPMIKILDILAEGKGYKTDRCNFMIIDENAISSENIQNFLSCLQFHIFFEDYINLKLISKGEMISNPLILINPMEIKGKIEGYFELDGSLLINKTNDLVLLECKNSRFITLEHLTHFLGKVLLVELVYGLKIKKIIFSTGLRSYIWEDLEKYPFLEGIEIYDREDFKNDFNRLFKE